MVRAARLAYRTLALVTHSLCLRAKAAQVITDKVVVSVWPTAMHAMRTMVAAGVVPPVMASLAASAFLTSPNFLMPEEGCR